MHLILGSGSPRRKEILDYFNLPFDQISSAFDEASVPFDGDPRAYAQTLSEGKGEALASLHPEAVILTADTIVFQEGNIYGKPRSESEALAILDALCRDWHSVFTALTVTQGKRQLSAVEETRVLFHPFSAEEQRRYHKIFHGLDKAGGYGIQKGGSVIVKRIEGCFYNVMGLPVGTLRTLLNQVGIDLWHYLQNSSS